MNPKELFTNPAMCVIPWTGFVMEPTGDVKNCVASKTVIGNVNDTPIQDILGGDKNLHIKENMLAGNKLFTCSTCHIQENGSKQSNIISSRIYYRKELRSVPLELYDDKKNFQLHHVDMRWSNACNLACVYCGPTYSSRWAAELGVGPNLDKGAKDATKAYVFENAHQLKNVYLAGGEPLLMNENVEFLRLLLEVNPVVNLRINTNLCVLDTKIFDLVCEFENVHWTVSVESTEQQFEYIRYGADWTVFSRHLERIQGYNHKISFNMLWFILNATEIFSTIDYFMARGFHPNSFIVGPLVNPEHFDVRNCKPETLTLAKEELVNRLNLKSDNNLLTSGYKLMSEHLDREFAPNLKNSLEQLAVLDNRRNMDSKSVFPNLYV